MSRKYKSNRGVALVAVIMVMIVAVILGTVILQISLAETKFSVMDKNRIEASYIARAGVEATAAWLVNPANNPTNVIGKESVPKSYGNGTFVVNVIGEPTGTEFVVQATGTVNGLDQTVSMVVHRIHLDGLAFDKTVFADEPINVSGSAMINGPIGSNGDIDVPEKNQGDDYEADDNMDVVFPSPVFPSDPSSASDAIFNNNGSIVFSSEGQVITYKTLELKNNKTLTINTDVGSKPMHLVLESIDAEGMIELQGKNRLFIYVKNTAIFGNTNAEKDGSNYIFGDPADLVILLGDNSTMTLRGNTALSGYVYGPQANVSLLTGSVTVGGGFNVRVFNGNGDFEINDYLESRESINLNDIPVNAYVKGNWIK